MTSAKFCSEAHFVIHFRFNFFRAMKDKDYPTCRTVSNSTKDTRNFTRSDNPRNNSQEIITSSNTAGDMDVCPLWVGVVT
jgi:hypothetical protein